MDTFLFFQAIQHDFLHMLLAAALAAAFRLVFIQLYKPYPLAGKWRAVAECFRYGFWWGLDFHAYVFLLLMLLVSLPAAILGTAAAEWRAVLFTLYAVLLYAAFMGKLIFYHHYHDIYNRHIFLGKHADKKNLADIFFNQNKGGYILAGFLPYGYMCYQLSLLVSSITPLAPPSLANLPSVLAGTPLAAAVDSVNLASFQPALDFFLFLLALTLFQWCRFGGTLRHRSKPEYDEIPAIVKADTFLTKATVDDFIALERVLKHPLPEFMQHDQETSSRILANLIPQEQQADLFANFKRRAKGQKLEARKIFFILAESHAQTLFDPAWERLGVVEASKKLRSKPNTFSVNHTLSAGTLSQTSLASLLLGIYDCDLELCEMPLFWENSLPTALVPQLGRLGYRSHFYYGGKLTWASMVHFTKGAGFTTSTSGHELTPTAPSTWLGVYDHIFLDAVADKIIASDRAGVQGANYNGAAGVQGDIANVVADNMQTNSNSSQAAKQGNLSVANGVQGDFANSFHNTQANNSKSLQANSSVADGVQGDIANATAGNMQANLSGVQGANSNGVDGVPSEITADKDFYFIYTTSNHGPYTMPYGDYGYNEEEVLSQVPPAARGDDLSRRRFAGCWYADFYINRFIERMQAAYPDSLFIVTGDHSAILTPFDTGIIPKREPYLRELTMPCLHFHHRDLNRSWFQAEIASHLNILPTIFELVAPAGFGYYSLLPSLLEPAARVVTP